jgi:hypothetical protein
VNLTAFEVEGAGSGPPNTFCVLTALSSTAFTFCCNGSHIPETVYWIAVDD